MVERRKTYIPEIGRTVIRADAEAKAAGVEKYAADYYGEGLLWAGVRRSGIPHGRIILIDKSEAENIPGVKAVLTGADVPGANRHTRSLPVCGSASKLYPTHRSSSGVSSITSAATSALKPS